MDGWWWLLVQGVELNVGNMVKAKDKTVTALTGGIELLFKKNKVCSFEPW